MKASFSLFLCLNRSLFNSFCLSFYVHVIFRINTKQCPIYIFASVFLRNQKGIVYYLPVVMTGRNVKEL